jgi:uncharacterized membrane protein
MSRKIRRIAYTALTAALVFIVTLLVKLPVPGTNGGYINLGDTVIFFSAYLLGGPLAAISAAIGSALADFIGGAAVYMLATFIIKGLMGLLFGFMAKSKGFPMYIFAGVLCGAVMTAGYAVYEAAVFGFAYAAGALPYNLLQWGGSVAVSIVLFPAAKRLFSTLRID